MQSKKLNLILSGTILFLNVVGHSQGIKYILYVNKKSYLINSKQEAQIAFKSREFEIKHPGKLEDFQNLSQKVERLSSVSYDSLTFDQKKELSVARERMQTINSEIGVDLQQARSEIELLKKESEFNSGQAIRSLLKKSKADAINFFPLSWYYLKPDYDVTDIFLDELNIKPWSRMVWLEEFKIKKLYFVDRNILLNRFSGEHVSETDFWNAFYSACKSVGIEVGADLISDLNESGFEAIKPDFDLTEKVASEMARSFRKR